MDSYGRFIGYTTISPSFSDNHIRRDFMKHYPELIDWAKISCCVTRTLTPYEIAEEIKSEKRWEVLKKLNRKEVQFNTIRKYLTNG